MRQQNVICLLSTKENTQLCDAIFQQRLFNNVFRITQQSNNFSLDELVQCLQFSVVATLKKKKKKKQNIKLIDKNYN